jgi:hypothetical protein
MRALTSRPWSGTLAATALALTLAACGTEKPAEDAHDDTHAVDARTSEAPTSEPPTSEPATTGPATLEDRLIPAEELPAVNELTVWEAGETAPEGGVPHGSCQRTSLVDIGAQDSVVRTYAGGDGVTGLQVVAEFADAKSAWRAHQVLKTWTTKCAEQLDAGFEKVGPLATVPVTGGGAQSTLVQYGDEGADEHTFAGIAIVRMGEYLSVVEIDVLGQDYDYEPGHEPATLAVPVAADQISGHTR